MLLEVKSQLLVYRRIGMIHSEIVCPLADIETIGDQFMRHSVIMSL